MSNEEWKDIEGYEGYYQISSLGRVKSLGRTYKVVRKGSTYNRIIREHIMQLTKNEDGYLRVSLAMEKKKRAFLVHRLVASAFIPNPLNKPCINHLDENKTNNKADNLEWCSVWENSTYGNRCKKIGEKSSKTPHTWLYKSVLQYSLQGILIKEYKSLREAANAVGAKSTAGIQSCCVGRLKSSMGYIWKYNNNNNNK